MAGHALRFDFIDDDMPGDGVGVARFVRMQNTIIMGCSTDTRIVGM